ncbi:MAG: hypothetical protein IKG46_03295 [Solobacterium sp.]|nr:hypothetical protein [Solobacterium sp.]
MRRQSHPPRKGMLSGYMTALFLMSSSVIMTAGLNDMYRMKTLENLKILEQRAEAEQAALQQLKCRIENGEEIPDTVYLDVNADTGITLTVFLDPVTKQIVSVSEQCRDP